MRSVTREDLLWIATGAAVLGSGGGGNPYRGRLIAENLMEGRPPVQLVRLEELPDDALCVEVGNIGAPVIGMERIPRGDEAYQALRALERHLGRRATHLIPPEVGGSNSLAPIVVAALAGLPVVDTDGMGRAFPEMQQTTFMIGGAAWSPAALCDYRHTVALLDEVPSPRDLERLARAITVAMGGAAGFACAPMSGSEVKRWGIPGTMSLARRIGRSIERARSCGEDAVRAASLASGASTLFVGKVEDVERRLTGGFARGRLRLASPSGELELLFQNENLLARCGERVVASTPDLICLLDERGEPVTTEVVRYGLRVSVIGIPAPAALRSPQALEVVGPAAFGYPVSYTPLPGMYGGP
ncbi:MAG: DUF917 domain-containing protein [Armatimonadetes bacterium]|nr:DUF917 domain-containing protein [Armatimonadota bacterium]